MRALWGLGTNNDVVDDNIKASVDKNLKTGIGWSLGKTVIGLSRVSTIPGGEELLEVLTNQCHCRRGECEDEQELESHYRTARP